MNTKLYLPRPDPTTRMNSVALFKDVNI